MLMSRLIHILRNRRDNDIVVGLGHRKITGVQYDSTTDELVIVLEHDDFSIDDLFLDEGERAFLAMHATYEANKQDDFRYHDKDPARRVELKARWMQIANALHEDPWGTKSESREG